MLREQWEYTILFIKISIVKTEVRVRPQANSLIRKNILGVRIFGQHIVYYKENEKCKEVVT